MQMFLAYAAYMASVQGTEKNLLDINEELQPTYFPADFLSSVLLLWSKISERPCELNTKYSMETLSEITQK